MQNWLVLGLVLAVLLSGCTTPPTEPPATPLVPSETRGFAMGTVAIPTQPLTTEAWISAFALLKDNAEFVLHHSAVDWSDFADGTDTNPRPANLEQTNFIVEMAKQNGLNVLVVIDPLRSDREEIDPALPAEVGRNFGDAKVRAAFKNYAVRVARDYQPAYLALGSEINTYVSAHPEDADNFLSLIEETALLVRKASFASKITTTFQYELLSGTAGTSDWRALDRLESSLDVVAITSYPSPWFATPDEIPNDYYLQVKSHTLKPIIFAESGWPAGGEASYNGSAANQKRFVERFPELTKSLNLKLWIWWFLHDWDGKGYPDFFKTMGLRTSTGQAKPAWQAWQQIQSKTLQ